MFRCLTRPISSGLRCPRSRTSSLRRARSPTADRAAAGEGTMPIEILMPALSPTMTEGNVAKWLKKEGDEVHSGDVLAEIETDKATMEFEAVDDGRLGRILVPEGAEGIKVNQPIALLLGEGEDPSALDKLAEKPATPVAAASAAEVPEPRPAAQPVPARGGNGKGRIFASPL